MKQLKAALVGAGNRGQAYANYSLGNPEQLQIIAIVDISEPTREKTKKMYSVADEYVFSNLDDFIAAKIECDFVINATMDEVHLETALKLLGAGYHLILEKPVVPKYAEFKEIQDLANEKGLNVLICHVLRYTPFYRTIKEHIVDGTIGEVISMELNEHVYIPHFLDSFTRGKWNSEERCGSCLLLAKCCHDTDLMCWLNGGTEPEKISSFGTRSLFIPKKAPEGATEFCYQCPHKDSCTYSAQRIHLELDRFFFQTWLGLNKPYDEITKEEKEEYLKTSNYGRCAYNAGGDIVDRQTVSVQYKNGSVATLTLMGGSVEEGRWLHIVGTKGEIVGYTEDGKFRLVTLDNEAGPFCPKSEEIDVSAEVVTNPLYAGHSGGDYALMHDAVRFFAGEGASVSITDINDSVNGHLIVYAAEESRKNDRIVKIDELKG